MTDKDAHWNKQKITTDKWKKNKKIDVEIEREWVRNRKEKSESYSVRECSRARPPQTGKELGQEKENANANETEKEQEKKT